MEKLVLTWDDLKGDVKRLANNLRSQQEWKGIVAIARGGLIPSSLIAYELDIRTVETISIASYGDDHQQSKLELLKPLSSQLENGEGWLVIDDLSDTGKTSEMIRKMLPKAYMAVIYAKPKGQPYVDQYERAVEQGTWIVFPWEED